VDHDAEKLQDEIRLLIIRAEMLIRQSHEICRRSRVMTRKVEELQADYERQILPRMPTHKEVG